MDGGHTLEQCLDITTKVLHIVFDQLHKQHVSLEGMLLKPNIILPGLDSTVQDPVDTGAEATVKCLLKAVPAVVPGIAFLSGR